MQYTGGKTTAVSDSQQTKTEIIKNDSGVHFETKTEVIEKAGFTPKQKLEEAQAISEAVLDAEVKIGELMARVPKAKNQYDAMDSGVHSTKADIIEKAGFTVKQVQRFETLAKNRDIVEQAKAETRENDDAGAKQRQPQIEHYYTGEQQRFDFTDKPICIPIRSTKSMLATALLLYAAELCLLGVSVKVYIFRLCLIALKDVCKPCMM